MDVLSNHHRLTFSALLSRRCNTICNCWPQLEFSIPGRNLRFLTRIYVKFIRTSLLLQHYWSMVSLVPPNRTSLLHFESCAETRVFMLWPQDLAVSLFGLYKLLSHFNKFKICMPKHFFEKSHAMCFHKGMEEGWAIDCWTFFDASSLGILLL